MTRRGFNFKGWEYILDDYANDVGGDASAAIPETQHNRLGHTWSMKFSVTINFETI